MATELRIRFNDYLDLQRFSGKTKTAYISAVADLAKYHRKPPDILTNDQIHQYLLYLIRERKLAWSSCNVAFSGLQCFYGRFLNRDKTDFNIPPRPRTNKLPEILSTQDVIRLIESTKDIRHRALLSMAYGSGLRVSELVALKLNHIESERKLVRVEQAKGHKDRYTLLSLEALDTLRQYWRVWRPVSYLFYGKDKNAPLSISSVQKIYQLTKIAAGINTGRGIHTLRHCFASHLLEQGVDIYTIKEFMGHSSIKTTTVYLHIQPHNLAQIKSPLDFLRR